MPVESPMNFIEDLVPSNPVEGDPAGDTSDHLRGIKWVLDQTFRGTASWSGNPDRYDKALNVGPRELEYVTAQFQAMENNFVTLGPSGGTSLSVLIEHLFEAGLQLKNNATISGQRADLTKINNLLGVDDQDVCHVGVSYTNSKTKIWGEDGVLKVGGTASGEPTIVHDQNLDSSGVMQQIFDRIYPIGAIVYSPDVNYNPAGKFGNTWTRIARGRFIVGVGSGNDGVNPSRDYPVGDDTVGRYQVELDTSDVPLQNHSHDIDVKAADGSDNGTVHDVQIGQAASGTLNTIQTKVAGDASVDPHENSPPAYGLYVWERTA